MSYPIQVEPQEGVPFLYNEGHTSMPFPGPRGLPRSSISTGRAQRWRKARQKVNDRIWPLHLLHTVVWLATLFAFFIAGWQTSSQMALARNWKDEAAVSRRWMPNRDFDPVMGQRTDVSDAAWDTMHSRYVGIEDPASEGYPPSSFAPEYGNVSAYAVSAFHQLHCLRTIRSAWFAVLERGPSVLDNPSGIPGHPLTKKALGPHITHCFDFIRQALMCFADSTLEPFLEEDGITLQPRGSSGWGVIHQCRDFNALVDWAEQRAIFQGL